jgi:hypothetical protein
LRNGGSYIPLSDEATAALIINALEIIEPSDGDADATASNLLCDLEALIEHGSLCRDNGTNPD